MYNERGKTDMRTTTCTPSPVLENVSVHNERHSGWVRKEKDRMYDERGKKELHATGFTTCPV
jgi:hypothetical protein